jgi:membrane-associated phospholipid phosphatase
LLSTDQKAPAQPIHLKAHAIVFVAGTATLVVAGALQTRLAPETCRWCDLHADGTDALNGLDRATRNALLWQHPNSASTVSDVVAYGVVPAVAFGLDGWAAHAAGRGGDFKVDALAIGEAIVLAANATEIVKYAAARQRPFAHARALGEDVGVAPSSSDNLSFTSAHTAVAFAMTVSAARVMTLRRYGHEKWVWGLGLPAAAAVGYFRIAGDRHYLTDVLGAAGIGTAMGLVVPRLAFTTKPDGSGAGGSVTFAPLISRSMIGISCTW